MADTSTNYIAWWGAGLSTLLALIKLFELWRDRFRIEVGYGFTDDPAMGNDILIRNLSGKPIILAYWELFYRPNIWPLEKDCHIKSPEDSAHDIRIEPNSSTTLKFKEMDHFAWGWKVMRGRRIYIRLHVAGRRAFIKRVYGH